MLYSEDKVAKAKTFISILRHTKGRWAGHPFQLLPWQEEILSELFGRLTDEGLRQYRTMYCEIPRKQGKSEFAAAIGLYMLFADDEQGAEVYSAAADRDQASLVFNAAAQMVRTCPALAKRCKIIDSQKRIVVYDTASFYRAISAEAYTKHGYNASCVIYDELHAAPNRELWDVLTTSMGAREQPLTIAITTAGYDRNSICWEQHEYARGVLEGMIEDPTYLGVIYAAEEDDDWQDVSTWEKANPSLGYTVKKEFLEQECRKARQMPTFENSFRRLYLNQWTSQETRWMPMTAWDACDRSLDKPLLAGRPCFAGLDLSSTTDISALALVFAVDDAYYVLPTFFIPENNLLDRERRDKVPYSQWVKDGHVIATPGNVVDYGYIRREVNNLHRVFDIREIAHDRWGATQLAIQLEEDGFTMIPFGQGFASMSAPTKELLKLVLDGKLVHGGNPVLRFMVDACIAVTDAADNVKLDKSKSTHRIDGAIALIMGLDRCLRQTEQTSVYEQRGLLTI